MIDKHESITAKLCAFARAWHSNKSRQKISDDYLAYDMMGKEEYDSIFELINHNFGSSDKPFTNDKTENVIKEYIAPIPLSRMLFSESRLQEFAKEYGKIQYVICGAGSDTFSFRNGNSNIEIFEIDHPDTQRYKLKKIKNLEWNIPPNVHFVSVNFEREQMTDKLIGAGYNPNIPTFYSILGVSYYLTLPVFTDTLSQISQLASKNSLLAFDYPQKSGSFPDRVKKLEQITENLGEKMRGGFDYNEVSRALYSLGFQIETYLNPQDTQKNYFEGRNDGLQAFENVSLISAKYTGGFDYE